jgi:hypothetical protein
MAPRPKGRSTFKVGKVFPDSEQTQILKMPGPIRDWQIKCVCGGTDRTCNSGWMKGIEDTIKPVIVPLIVGDRVRLNVREQTLIAAWATLKTMVAAYDRGSKIRIHHMQRKFMMNNKIPPYHGWGVWIGHYERQNWRSEHISHSMLVLPDKPGRKSYRANYYNSGASTYVVGKLFIHVIYTPMPRFIQRWRFADLHNGTLYRIWPPTDSFSISWPGSALTDMDADYITGALGAFILDTQRRKLGDYH